MIKMKMTTTKGKTLPLKAEVYSYLISLSSDCKKKKENKKMLSFSSIAILLIVSLASALLTAQNILPSLYAVIIILPSMVISLYILYKMLFSET